MDFWLPNVSALAKITFGDRESSPPHKLIRTTVPVRPAKICEAAKAISILYSCQYEFAADQAKKLPAKTGSSVPSAL